MPLTRADFTDPWETIYSFVDHQGVNTHIASARLRAWCLEQKPETFWVPLEPKLALQFVRENSISQTRCMQLNRTLPLARAAWEPLIFVHDGELISDKLAVLMADSALLVDGHHRYAVAVARGHERILGWCLTKAQWKPFEIVDDSMNLTQEELVAIPTVQKEHLQ